MQAHKLCALWAHPFPRIAFLFDASNIFRIDPFLVYISCIFVCSLAILLIPSKSSRCNPSQSLVTSLLANPVSRPVRAHSSPSPVSKSSSIPRKDVLVAKDSHTFPATVEIDAGALRKLLEDRLQLHLQVKSLEKSSELLRHRVWSLDEYEKQLVRDTGREMNALVDRLTAEKDAAVAAERQNTAEAEAARDALAQEVAELRAERNALRRQKDALAADLEALHAETADEQCAQGDKTILDLEEKLAREGVKASRAAADVKRLQDELSKAKAQLAVKQQTVDDVTQRMDSVTAQLNDELRTTEASLALLQAEHDLQRTQVTAYKTALVRAKMERSQLATTVTSLCAHESVIYAGVRARDAEIARLKAILGPSQFQDVFT
ncbi:hypothetical protein L227DRAFT_657896 [Lentinus tigrinus ALCF2SS1-6]|uniref:Uncharacterized protein n=1 Tax=Lentinus tigrinus ALCF2SS1-6 TaxID=1328759 RepID=A0A5C2RTM6_9APHY|nr:hypothetical protein L227DRAFT_657896 [Lentinus tigrinus ALCF2SS1-6]